MFPLWLAVVITHDYITVTQYHCLMISHQKNNRTLYHQNYNLTERLLLIPNLEKGSILISLVIRSVLMLNFCLIFLFEEVGRIVYKIAISIFNSVAQSCPTLCNPMNCSTPGLPVHHQLPESTQTHVHWVSDAVQPFNPLSSPSPALNLS